MTNFDKDYWNILAMAQGRDIRGHLTNNAFEKIYPFANENIKGYIKRFSLEDKKLMTVGSSSDTVIIASLYGCKDITLYDICPYVKYYYELKIASLLSLNYHEFIEFLLYKKDNNIYLSRNYFKKIKDTLKCIDINSYDM